MNQSSQPMKRRSVFSNLATSKLSVSTSVRMSRSNLLWFMMQKRSVQLIDSRPVARICQRRERDSNPRNGRAVHRISSPAQSVTLASLLMMHISRLRVQRYGKSCDFSYVCMFFFASEAFFYDFLAQKSHFSAPNQHFATVLHMFCRTFAAQNRTTNADTHIKVWRHYYISSTAISTPCCS